MSKSVQKVLKNSLWQSLGGVAVTGLNFLLVIGYARILGPEQFGSLVSSQAKVIIWAMLVDLGLSHGLIGALTAAESQKDSQERQGFRSRDLIIRVLAVRMAGAMLGAIFILALASAHSNEHSFWQDISFLPYLFALAMQQTAMAYANFRNRQALSVVAMLAGNFSSMAVCLWMAWSGFSPRSRAFIMLSFMLTSISFVDNRLDIF
jgi:O-antigen/teichoic acid export membrane protein